MALTAKLASPAVSIASFRRSAALRPNLRASVYDAGAFGFMVGAGENYIAAFALAIGLGEIVSGVTSSVPMLCGGILQLVSLYALPRFGSYKRWIVTGVALQAAVFIPMIFAAFSGSIPAWAFFMIISCYWGLGLSSAPAWNAWIGHIVPNKIRSRYFAKRTRVIQIATLIGFLGGGWWLSYMQDANQILLGYAVLFSLALSARFASAYFLDAHQTSAADDFAPPRSTSLWQSWTGVSPKARYLIAYLVCMQGFIQFSGPYFIPFMMKQLGYGYEAFVSVLASALIARALSMTLWGRVARKYGSQGLLWIGGLGLLPLSTLWIVSDSWPWLVFVQALSGFLWSAYELAFFLMFLDYIPQRRRADMLSIYYLANSIAHCCGALAGGWWIASHGIDVAAYHGVFLISAIGRVACLVLLWKIWTSAKHPTHPGDDSEFSSPLREGSMRAEATSNQTDSVPLISPIIDQNREAA
jgi:MFS family permease